MSLIVVFSNLPSRISWRYHHDLGVGPPESTNTLQRLKHGLGGRMFFFC